MLWSETMLLWSRNKIVLIVDRREVKWAGKNLLGGGHERLRYRAD